MDEFSDIGGEDTGGDSLENISDVSNDFSDLPFDDNSLDISNDINGEDSGIFEQISDEFNNEKETLMEEINDYNNSDELFDEAVNEEIDNFKTDVLENPAETLKESFGFDEMNEEEDEGEEPKVLKLTLNNGTFSHGRSSNWDTESFEEPEEISDLTETEEAENFNNNEKSWYDMTNEEKKDLLNGFKDRLMDIENNRNNNDLEGENIDEQYGGYRRGL